MICSIRPVVTAVPLMFTLFLNGCLLFDLGVRGSGVSKTENRSVEEFDRIKVSGIGRVEVTCGETQSLSITADDNLLELIESRVEDGVLRIRPTESIRPVVDLTIRINVSSLQGIDFSGAVDAKVTNASGSRLVVDVSGASQCAVDGAVDEVLISASGASSVEAQSLIAKTVNADASGASVARVHATESLDADASGASSVECSGHPAKVRQATSGASRVRIAE